MKTKDFGIELTLSSASVDKCSERIDEYLQTLGIDAKERLRIRLSCEEILLNW